VSWFAKRTKILEQNKKIKRTKDLRRREWMLRVCLDDGLVTSTDLASIFTYSLFWGKGFLLLQQNTVTDTGRPIKIVRLRSFLVIL
jgi:hypothetical protein